MPNLDLKKKISKQKISKKRPPKKGDLRGNQAYLKDWDSYLADRPGRTPLLLPIAIGINGDGEIVRERIKADQVEAMFRHGKGDLPKYLSDPEVNTHNAEAIFEDYIDYFKAVDGNQGPVPEDPRPTPLDLKTPQPVWMLFHVPSPAWKFSENTQFSTENDDDGLLRNFVKICTMDDRNYLLLANRSLCNPEGLKFNLHVTIYQIIDGIRYETPIIIDPGADNSGGQGSGGAGGGHY